MVCLPIVTNCSNNYGPYHFPEKLIPLMIINALEGQKLPVYGEGRNVRDWLYVEDHARALVLIADARPVGESYCSAAVASGPISMWSGDLRLDRRACAGQAIGPRKSLITFVTDRPGQICAMPSTRQDRARARLGAARDIRDRSAQDCRVVSGQPPVVGAHSRGIYRGERLGVVA